MADNIPVTPGAGRQVAADEIATVHYQRIKLTLGDDGINDGDVSETNPIPTKAQRSANGGITSIPNLTSSQVVLAANVNRKGFIINNASSTVIFLAFSATSSNSAFTIRLTANSSYTYNLPIIYTGVVSMIATVATGNTIVTELT